MMFEPRARCVGMCVGHFKRNEADSIDTVADIPALHTPQILLRQEGLVL